ncbi:hypothetical protein [Aureispira anguillae]|uniref:Uncharacterized protein n=1 Tax=Aureispira anguillae TaxID=2864201 RepID=A0A915YAF2_9BACT|nr:hypothetical protein [Aureispira anguillae]BDS09572.1 hypothetical protein AsAng_0002760 [Aureispira anguillae]
MTPKQEMVAALLDTKVLQDVTKQFRSKQEIVPVDNSEMDYRLFLTGANTINFELLVTMPTYTGVGDNQSYITLFKPIGFFHIGKKQEVELTVLYEFEKELDFLIKTRMVSPQIEINKLSIIENAIIAAFSNVAVSHAQRYEDAVFKANGLSCEIWMANEGFPQFFLDDSYNINGPIAAYLIKQQGTINPIVGYESLFNEFHEKSLLSAFKRL